MSRDMPVASNCEANRFSKIVTRPINRWWFVLGCALVNIFASGIFLLYSVNIFFVDAMKEFGWPKSTTSLLLSVFYFSAGPGFLILGWAISQYGIRKPSVISALGYAATILLIPFLPPNKTIFLINFFLMGIFGTAACALPFAIAISGAFDRNRGLALGLGAAGAGLGSAITASISNILLEGLGWRTGILTYSCIAVAVILFCLIFLVRTPCGAVAREDAQSGAPTPSTFRQLLDREMFIILTVLVLNAVSAVGIVANLVPLLSERGISTSIAASLLSTVGLSSWIGRVVIGWLLDRIFAPYVACGTFAIGAIGALLLIYGGSLPLAFVGGAMIGICMGAEQDLAMYLVSRYFPLAAYSKAVSLSWIAWAWGGGAGSFIAAQSFIFTQDYEVALWVFIALFVLAAVLIMRLPAYRVKPHQDDQDRA